MAVNVFREVRTMGVLLFCTAIPLVAGAAQLDGESGRRIEVRFLVEGGQINVQQPQKAEPKSIDEGGIYSGDALLDAMNAMPPADGAGGKFLDSTLFLSVSSEDGALSSRQKAAFCHELDLYSKPSAPEQMLASCDGAIFSYAVTENGISFSRDGEEIGTFGLESGFYLINGALSRIPVVRQ